MEKQNITPIKKLLLEVRKNVVNSEIEIFKLKPENYHQIIYLREKTENRCISGANVREKTLSIKKIGIVDARPVLIDAELFNKYNMRKKHFSEFVFPVSDGQHLVQAAKKQNMDIPICIVPRPENVTFKDFIRSLNASNKPWSLNDYTFHDDTFRQIYEDTTYLPFFRGQSRHNKSNFVFALYTGDFRVGQYLKGIKPLKRLKYYDVIVAKIITMQLDNKLKTDIRKIFPVIEMYKLYYTNYAQYFDKINFESCIQLNKDKQDITNAMINNLKIASGDSVLVADTDFYGEHNQPESEPIEQISPAKQAKKQM